jgi:hypothetical protein
MLSPLNAKAMLLRSREHIALVEARRAESLADVERLARLEREWDLKAARVTAKKIAAPRKDHRWQVTDVNTKGN